MALQPNTHCQISASVESEIHAKYVNAQILHMHWDSGIDAVMNPQDRYWLDLCLTPRPHNVRACYLNRWGENRFERMGALFIVPPEESLHAHCEQQEIGGIKSQKSIVCQLAPELMDEWFNGELQWDKRRLEGSLDIPDRSIHGLLMRLTREMTFPGFAGEMITELVACQLAIELGRHFANGDLIPLKGGLAARHLRLIDERVKTVGKAPTLTELAELCKISVRHLSRGFQISRGCSIGSYVEKSCLENAKKLILKEESITNVAYVLGYASRASFSLAFRRNLGITPSQFRKLA